MKENLVALSNVLEPALVFDTAWYAAMTVTYISVIFRSYATSRQVTLLELQSLDKAVQKSDR